MAQCALLEFRVEQIVARGLNIHALVARSRAPAVMALKANREYHRARQQACIHGAMRHMAHGATLHLCAGMREDEWSAFINVTIQARRFGIKCAHQHGAALPRPPGSGEGAMGIVAVRALHEAFVYAVVRRHLELRADIRVTRVAHLILFLGQKILLRRRMMDGVAARARDSVQSMFRAVDIRLTQIFCVASKTIFQRRGGLHK